MLSTIVKLLLIGGIIYLLIRVIKDTPIVVRWLCLVLFVVTLIVMEWGLRKNGTPYFTVSTAFQNCITQIIPADSVVDAKVMLCDSFGVNKLNPSATLHKEDLLNKDGFRSLHDFSQASIDSIHAQGKKAVFLIGDSYTYGMNADSGYSFASLLENTGRYGILNAGIPGTDGPQYRAVVNEYIMSRKLKPDRILVCINGANDLAHFPDRRLTPGIPILFYTNVGGLYSFQSSHDDDTIFPSAKSAYQNILDRYTLIGVTGPGWWTDLIAKSFLATRLMGLFQPAYIHRSHSPAQASTVDPIYSHIRAIKDSCASARVPVLFVLLPGKEFVKNKKAPSMDGVLSLDPTPLTLDDYTIGGDDHPVNSGHKKIADQLDHILARKIN